jgi:hypothetical protein
MTTDTPLTDAAHNSDTYEEYSYDAVLTCSRKLELKLQKAEARLAEAETLIKRGHDGWKKAVAEVERLNKRPFGCKCETFREKALGDGCEECNKALVIEMLTDERDELEAEVERLKEQLESTKLLALKFWKVLEENGFKIELPK